MGESMGKTSYAVRKRYEDRVYEAIRCQLDKDLVAKFKAACDRNGDTYNSVMWKGIELFMEETTDVKESEK